MPKAYIDITAELFQETLKGLTDGVGFNLFRVHENPVPRDASFLHAEMLNHEQFRIWFESDSVQEGEQVTPVLGSFHGTVTVWKDGTHKFWSEQDAIYAASDPDFLTNIHFKEVTTKELQGSQQ